METVCSFNFSLYNCAKSNLMVLAKQRLWPLAMAPVLVLGLEAVVLA